jgi:hypothetical protein
MFDYEKIPKEHVGYYLFLEGIANELMHILQQRRKEIKLDLMDWIDIAVVEDKSSDLTSAIQVFVDEIVSRCRIKFFSPNPIMIEGTRLWKKEVVEGATINGKSNTYTYDLYIRKHYER